MPAALPNLPPDLLRAQLVDVVDEPNWSVAVLLTTGDFLFGDLMPTRGRYSYVGVRPQAHYPKWWPKPEREDEATAVYLDRVDLRFPVPSEPISAPGVVRIPNDVVASIRRSAWVASLLEHGISSLVGPIAVAICQANMVAAERAGLDIFRLGVASLRVPPRVIAEGIAFETSETIYLDWHFLDRAPSVGLSLGIAGIGGQVKLGSFAMADGALKSNLLKSVALPQGIVSIRGLVAEPDEETTTDLEGEASEVVILRQPLGAATVMETPLIIKTAAIAYPRELWQFIRSELTVLAEERQVPIQIRDRVWSRAYLARAIGYVP